MSSRSQSAVVAGGDSMASDIEYYFGVTSQLRAKASRIRGAIVQKFPAAKRVLCPFTRLPARMEFFYGSVLAGAWSISVVNDLWRQRWQRQRWPRLVGSPRFAPRLWCFPEGRNVLRERPADERRLAEVTPALRVRWMLFYSGPLVADRRALLSRFPIGPFDIPDAMGAVACVDIPVARSPRGEPW